MSEVIHSKRRKEKAMDWLATLLAAALLAALAALLVEGILTLIGLAIGDLTWHRSLVEQRITKFIEWLDGLPILNLFGALLDGVRSSIPRDGIWRDLSALCILFYSPALFPARRIGPTLIARYDDETLRPKPPVDLGMRWAGPLGKHQVSAWQKLREWCFEDIGTGATPLWKPWQMPDVSKPFSIAILTGINGVGKSHLAEALSRELDGSLQLEACASTFERWRMKLYVKLHECLWWRIRRLDQPWDCGYLVEDPAARKRLGQFLPRRSTLLVADELQGDSLIECLTDLSMRRAEFRHPVRLLIIDATPPSALRLAWDARKLVWKTDLHELGEVTTVDLSGVHFDVAQFRGLVGAQVRQSQERLYLTGGDDHWKRLVEALEFQPILETEAIRLVRDSGIAFDDLLADKNLPDTLVDRQEQRDTPKLPPDLYGKERDVLRERIISARAAHRESALLAALGLNGKDDETYLAVLLATMANGASMSRLTRLMGWKTDRLSREHIVNIFGSESINGWVPPIKPAVIADELLRRYFNAPRGAILSVDIHETVAGAMRTAWLTNPGGTVATAKRWAKQRLQDDFAKSLQHLPDLKDLHEDPLLSASMRIDLVRGLFELAILHEGDITPAQAALDELSDAEIPVFDKALSPLLSNPAVHGLPALCLWLGLVRRRLSMPEQLPRNVDEYLIALLERARGLVLQSILVYSPPEALRGPLFKAVVAVLPSFARSALGAAGNARFRDAVGALELQSRRNLVLPYEIQKAIKEALARQLQALAQPPAGEDAPWAQTLLELLARAEISDSGVSIAAERFSVDEASGLYRPTEPLSLQWGQCRALSLIGYLLREIDPERTWQFAEQMSLVACSQPAHEGIQLEYARALSNVSWGYKDIDPARCEKVAQAVGAVAGQFPEHEGIQREYATVWRLVTWAYKDINPARCEQAAQAVGAVAGQFPAHEGIQREYALAWGNVSWAHQYIDPARCEQVVQVVGVIAGNFPSEPEIKCEYARAWRLVSFAYEDIDPARCEQAAQTVGAVAGKFPAYEDIQCENAQAWRNVCVAYSKIDPLRCEQALQTVGEIAGNFPSAPSIQHEYAQAWRNVSLAYSKIDPLRCEQALQAVGKIAGNFPSFPEIQCEYANAWRLVGLAYEDIDPTRCEQAAQVVKEIAGNFPNEPAIQREYTNVLRHVSWAYMDIDPARCEQVAHAIGEIAAMFPTHEAIQHEYAQAWRLVTWAYKDIVPARCAEAAQAVGEIASQYPAHEGIQLECARAWRLVTWAYKDSDPARCAETARAVGAVAGQFPAHEGIQHESTLAWCYALESAVEFNDSAQVETARQAFDCMSGKTGGAAMQYLWSPRPVAPRVLEECTQAYATYEAWRRARGDDGPAAGARTEA